MARDFENTWSGENRLDRQNSASADGFSTLNGPLGEDAKARERRRPGASRPWGLRLALPVVLGVIAGAAAVHEMLKFLGPR